MKFNLLKFIKLSTLLFVVGFVFLGLNTNVAFADTQIFQETCGSSAVALSSSTTVSGGTWSAEIALVGANSTTFNSGSPTGLCSPLADTTDVGIAHTISIAPTTSTYYVRATQVDGGTIGATTGSGVLLNYIDTTNFYACAYRDDPAASTMVVYILKNKTSANSTLASVTAPATMASTDNIECRISYSGSTPTITITNVTDSIEYLSATDSSSPLTETKKAGVFCGATPQRATDDCESLYGMDTITLFEASASNACSSTGAGGNLNAAGSWTSCGSTTPQLQDTITINSGSPITVTANKTVSGVTVGSSGTLTVNSAIVLTGAGNFANSGTVTGAGGVTVSGAASVISGSGSTSGLTGAFIVSGSGSPSITAVTTFGGALTLSGATINVSGTITSTGTLTISGTVTNSGTVTASGTFTGGGSWTQNNGSTLNLAGATTNANAVTTFSASTATNTVNYSGTTQTLKASITHSNLTISGAGIKTFPSGAITINGIFSIENAANANTYTSSPTYGSAATLQYNAGASSRTVVTAEWPATFSGTGGVIIKGSGGAAITLNNAKVLDTGAPLNINSGGTLNTSGSNYALTIGTGNFVNAGTFTANNSLVTFTGTSGTLFTNSGTLTAVGSTSQWDITSASGSPTLLSGNATFHILKIATTGGATIINAGGNITTDNNSGNKLWIASGVFNQEGRTITPGTSGTLQVDNSATYCLGGANASTQTDCASGDSAPTQTSATFPNFTTKTLGATSNFVYLTNADTTVTSASYGNLILRPRMQTTGKTYTLPSSLVVNNNFDIVPRSNANLALTVNLASGGVAVTGTTTVTPSATNSPTALLDTVNGSNYPFSTGKLDIGANGTFNIRNSTLTINGTSSTLFTRVGTFSIGGSSTVALTGASGSPTINSGTITFDALTISGATTKTLAAAIIVNGTLTLTSGTLNAGNQDITMGAFSSSNANTRAITMGSGTWTLTGTDGWDLGASTGMTVTPNSSTIRFTDSSATVKTFGGGDLTYNNIWLDPGAGTGNYSITGSNTFADFKDIGTGAHTILFGANSVTTVTSFTVSGADASNRITLNSDNGFDVFTLNLAGGGTVDRSYLNIQHSVATPSDTWYAGTTSVNNNSVDTAGSGWTFTAAPPSCTSQVTTGNWNTVGTWNCGHVPTTGEKVVIRSIDTITMDVNSAVLGAIVINGILTTSGTNYSLSGTTLNIASGSTLTANGSTITLSGTTGPIFTRVGTFTAGTSTVAITGTGSFTVNSGTITFNNLTLSGTGTKTFNADIVINGDLTNGSGVTMSVSSNLTFGGNFVNNGIASIGGGAIIISGTGTQSIGGYTTTGLTTLTKTAGTATFTGAVSGGALTLNGSGGTLDFGSAFNALNATGSTKVWLGIAVNPTNQDVYAVVLDGDIYKQTAGSGNFNALNATGSSKGWRGIAVNSTNGDVYATVYNGDIYKQTAGSGSFNALNATGSIQAWRGIAVNSSNGDVYSVVEYGDIYKQTAGSGNFNALNATGSSKEWIGIAVNPTNGDVYANVFNDYLYKQTAGSGSFNALLRNLEGSYGVAVDSSNGDVYAALSNGDIYKQTAGSGNFNTLNPTGSFKNWWGIAVDSSNHNVYLGVSSPGDIYKQDGIKTFSFSGTFTRTAGTLKLNQNILNLGGTVSGTGGTLDFSSGTVNYNGTTQTLAGATTYANLTLSGNGAKTFPSGAITVNGTLSIENGTNTNTFSGSVSYGIFGGLQYNAGSSARTASTEWPSIFNSGINGVSIMGTGAITLGESKQMGNNGNIPLNLYSGSIITPSTNTITLHGDYRNYGGTWTAAATPVTITGTTSAQSIDGFTTTGLTSMTKTGGTATMTGSISGAGLTINGTGGTLNLGTGNDSTFISQGAGTLNWIGVAVNSNNGDVFGANDGGDIYKQTAGIGSFVAQSAGIASLEGVAVNSTTGDVFGVSQGGDIYKQTAGTGSFVAQSAGAKSWHAVAVNPNNGDVFGAVYGGDIWKQTAGTGSFVAQSAGTKNWIGVAVNPTNGDVFGSVYGGGDIWKQTAGTGSFVAQSAAGSQAWTGVAVNSTTGDVFGSGNGSDIYKQSSGTGSFNPLNVISVAKIWYGVAVNSNNGDVYVAEYAGGIYKRGILHNFTGTLTRTAGTLDVNTSTLKIATSSGTGGTFTATSSTVEYTGAAAAISVVPYLNLRLTGGGTATGAVTSVSGALTMSSSTVWTASAITTTLTSLNLNGTSSLTLGANLTVSGIVGLIAGTLNTGNFNITAANFNSSNSSTRALTLGTGNTFSLTGTGTVWNTATTTGLTFTPSTSTIKLVQGTGSATAKTFAGGGQTYNNIWFAPATSGTSTGAITITGSNTFNDFKDDNNASGAAHSILFTPTTTTTVTTFTVSGTSGNLITINSTDNSTTHTLTKAGGGTIDVDYLNIQHSVATPSSTWYAGTTSTDNNSVSTAGSGWIFTGLPNTLGNGTDGASSTIAPGASATEIDRFSLVRTRGTDTVTGLTVTLAGDASAYTNITTVGVYTTGDTLKCSATPSSNTVALTSCAISVTTSSTEYVVKITPKTHANMPAVPGASYATTATVTSTTSTSGYSGTDSGSATITVDNASPGAVTSSTVTGGDTLVDVAWTNPGDSDFTTDGTVVVLRSASAVTDVPVEGKIGGTAYVVGNTIGSATVACVTAGSPPASTCQDTGLTNGNTYYYKIFTEDSRGNYNAGTVPTGSPVTLATNAITGTTDVTGSPQDVVRIVINGSLDSALGDINSTNWTITPTTLPTSGQTVLLYIDGQEDANESATVLNYDGTGTLGNMFLNKGVVSIGGDNSNAVTLANMGLYDCDQDEDIPYSSNTGVLLIQGCTNSYTDETLSIPASQTLTVSDGQTVTTEKINTSGSLNASGSPTITLNGTSGTLFTGTFTTPATSTVEVASPSGSPTLLASANTFHILKINSTATVINAGANIVTSENSGNKLWIASGVFNQENRTITAGTAGTLQIDSGGTFCLGGSTGATNITCDSGATQSSGSMPSFTTYTFNPASTVIYLGDIATTVSQTPTYGNLELKPKFVATERTYTLGGAMTINGNFTINPSGGDGNTLTVNPLGNITVASGKTTTITRTGTSVVSVLDLLPSATTYTLSTGFLGINTGGTLDNTGVSTANIDLTGTGATLFALSGGTFYTGTSTVTLSGNGAATVNSGSPTFYNLTSSGTGVKTLGAAITIGTSGTLTVSSGSTFDPSTYLVTFSGSNTFSHNGTIRVGATTYAGNFSMNTNSVGGGSTFEYNRSGDQTINTNVSNVNHLVLSGSGTKTLAGSVSMQLNAGTSTITINSGAILALSSFTFEIDGTGASVLTGTGTLNGGTGTFKFTGNGAVTIPAYAYYNLDLSPTITTGRTYTLNTTNVLGNLSINPTAGSALELLVNMGADVAVTGTTTITRTTSATSKFDAVSGTNRNLETGWLNIGAGGTYLPQNSALTLSGTTGTLFILNGGTFTPSGSTVDLTGNGNAIINSGAPTLNDLSVSGTGTKKVGSDLAIGGTLSALSQTTRNWYGISVDSSNQNVYATVDGGDIYKQTAGSGNFIALSQTSNSWRGISVDSSNQNVYAVVASGDIYKQTAGTGNFIALSQTLRNWRSISVDSSNQNVYAVVASGDIYKQTAGTGNFIALSQTSRSWYGISVDSSNQNVYATVNSGDIYKQTAGAGNFIALSQTSRSWYGISVDSSNQNVYAVVDSGDIYKQTAGTGDFVALSQTSRSWADISVDSSNQNVYATAYGGDIYKHTTSLTLNGTLDINNASGALHTGARNLTIAGDITNSGGFIAGSTPGISVGGTVTNSGVFNLTSADADAVAFLTAAGITDKTISEAVGNLVTAAKAHGWWYKADAIYPFVADGADNTARALQQKWNLKDPRDLDAAYRLAFSGGITHASTGVTGNGSTGFANTNLVSNTLSQNDWHISTYSRTNTNGTEVEIGARYATSLNGDAFLEARTSDVTYYGGNGVTTTYISFADTDSRGYYLGTRTGSAARAIYKNGTSRQNDTTTSATLNDKNIYLLALNNNGTAANFSTKQIAFATIGDGITSTMAANMYNDIEAFQTALGRNVAGIKNFTTASTGPTLSLTGTGTVWNNTGNIISGLSTIKLTNASASAKTFAGGSKVYNNLWLAPGSGTGNFTISGNNTFNDFKDNGTAGHSILFTAGSTQTLSTWNVSGANSSNRISLDSTTTGTHNLVKTGTADIIADFLNIQHSIATPNGEWLAGTGSVNNQATATAGYGWMFNTRGGSRGGGAGGAGGESSGGGSGVTGGTGQGGGGGGAGGEGGQSFTAAVATANMQSNAVNTVTVNSAGTGYTSTPTVYFCGGGGSGAVATATRSGTTILSVAVNNGGTGYTSTPTVQFGVVCSGGSGSGGGGGDTGYLIDKSSLFASVIESINWGNFFRFILHPF